jgi:hypothetical protein
MNNEHEFRWLGNQENFVDEINIKTINDVIIGRFGGNSAAGQYKNEDGCLVWVNGEVNYEFVVLLDAHQTSESAELVLDTIHYLKKEITHILRSSPKKAFSSLYNLLFTTFDSETFKESCKKVQGETAFLCVVRKGRFLWWFSVGDCILFLNHPELEHLNEYQQNHRSFYEWIGKVNTFELEVPCFSTGTKELRKGINHIFVTTDGLVECPNACFDEPKEIFKPFMKLTNEESVSNLLNTIKEKNVRDSTTLLSWFIEVEAEASKPSSG